MAAPIYTVSAGADVALVAATAKTVIGVKSAVTFSLLLKMISIGFDQSGASAPTNEPVVVELVLCTFGVNPPGTNSTSETPIQWSGRVLAHGTSAASNWTAEPTTITILDEFTCHPQSGFKEYFPLGDEPDCALGEGFGIRLTAPNAVNVRPTMRFSRC